VSGRGLLVVSIDLELAWGTCDRPLSRADRRLLDRERMIVSRLLRDFTAFDVRATWAVVGHLLLDGCPRRDGRIHPEIPRPVERGAADWFRHHPAGPDPHWFGRDLVAQIRGARPAQEIGSHSFCHVPYAEGRTSPAAVCADILEARRRHRAAGLPFESFVFPRNVVGFRPLLAAAGIRVYRGARRHERLRPGHLRRAVGVLDYLLRRPPTVRPVVDPAGLLDVPGSMLLYSRRGPVRWVSVRRVIARAARALDRAATRGEVFHLWFHPANFAERPDEQFAILDGILAHAARLRSAGRLDHVTLGDLGRRLPGRRGVPA
jgi:hypothetical protein